jgi:predicted DNA-binding transcriptional regulator YafY
MKKLTSIERLHVVLNYINSHKYCSFESIQEELVKRDFYPTDRTIQRDLKTIRDTCYIDIKYCRRNQGYYIDENSFKDLNDWLKIFQVFHTANSINQSFLSDPSNLDFIDFDQTILFQTENVFESILSAIIDRKKISFHYNRFWDDEMEEINLSPYLLKQYLNRWYIVGLNQHKEFRCYGIERISNFERSFETFNRTIKNPKYIFSDLIGLYSENEKENIILSYDSFQGQYVKTQPLHSSQTILIDTEQELRIQISVKPNYELEEQILKQGDRVLVLEPIWLRDKILNRLKDAIENYQTKITN